jgi:plasmid stabilization system protein ParE
MPRLIWSPAALHEVQRRCRFLAEKNTDAAKRAAKTIREGMKIIAIQPGIGRPAEELDAAYRERPIDFGDSGYLVLYRYNKQTAVGLAVRHRRETGHRAWASERKPLLRRMTNPVTSVAGGDAAGQPSGQYFSN